jgi:hypothetical protein
MNTTLRRIVGLALVLSLLFSSYLLMVQIVSAFEPSPLIKSLSLMRLEDASFGDEFAVGDEIVIVVESDVAEVYAFRIYRGESLVFEGHGRFNGSTGKTYLRLVPPTFNVGRYSVLFDVSVYNCPIFGVAFFDSGRLEFEVVGVGTKLEVDAVYDDLFRSLNVHANLTDDLSRPVVGESVDFQIRLANRQRLTDGWIPLGSAITDVNGTAVFRIAFGMRNGNYSLKTCHKGNANFAESEDVTNVEIFSALSFRMSNLEIGSRSYLGDFVPCNLKGNLTVRPSSYVPYALLPMNVTAEFSALSPLDGIVGLFFFYDTIGAETLLGGVPAECSFDGLHYIYRGDIIWAPEETGLQRIVAGIVNGTYQDIMNATNGIGIDVSECVDLDVQRCPSDSILQFLEAACGDVLSVSAGFFMPRCYKAESNGFYAASTIGQKFIYNGLEYVLDEPVSSISLKLYVNGSLKSSGSTGESGLAVFPLGLNFVGGHLTLNVTCVVDESVTLYERKTVSRIVSLTKVSLRDVGVGGSDSFKFNYTINDCKEECDLSVGAANKIEAVTSLSGMGLWNVSVSFIAAKNITCAQTSSGVASVPSGSDYLRVIAVYATLTSGQRVKIRFSGGQEVFVDSQGCARIPLGATSLTVLKFPLLGDINGDNVVNFLDASLLGAAWGSHPGDPNWNPRADLNNDGTVNFLDAIILSANFGKTAVIDALIEFLKIFLDKKVNANNVGSAITDWSPCELGVYLVQARLPSEFSVSVASGMNVTELDVSSNRVDYFEVIKRQISVSVDYEPSEPGFDDNITLIVNVFDQALKASVIGISVNFYIYTMYGEELSMGSASTNTSGVAVFSFVPSDYHNPPTDPLCAYFTVGIHCAGNQSTEEVWEYVSIDTRYPTRLVFLGDEVMNVHVGSVYDLRWRLTDESGFPLEGKVVGIYYMNMTGQGVQADSDGLVQWLGWRPPYVGTFWFRAVYNATLLGVGYDPYYKESNEVRVVAVADVVPVSILFDVQPREFKPGDDITLAATVFNASSSLPLPSETVSFYVVDSAGNPGPLGNNVTNASGVAIWRTRYVIGPNAYMASVGVNQTVICSPVTLTVARKTVLLLNVSREEGSSVSHVFSGKLLSGDEPVIGRRVKIYVNDSLKADTVTRDLYGDFSVKLNLQPINNKPTDYNVQAVFEGDEPCNATAYGYTPNGTRYAICTTIQYGFRPTSNSTTLIAEPQATQIVTTTKTPEQMQQEAEQGGWLSTWHEFTWWYPWYRFHVVCTYLGATAFDIGISLLPFGNTLQYMGWFMQTIINLLPKVSWKIVTGLATAEFLSLFSSTSGVALILASLTTFSLKAVSIWLAWNSIEDLTSVWFGILIPTVVSLVKNGLWDLFQTILDLMMATKSLAEIGFGKLYSLISTTMNIAFLAHILQRLDELGAF